MGRCGGEGGACLESPLGSPLQGYWRELGAGEGGGESRGHTHVGCPPPTTNAKQAVNPTQRPKPLKAANAQKDAPTPKLSPFTLPCGAVAYEDLGLLSVPPSKAAPPSPLHPAELLPTRPWAPCPACWTSAPAAESAPSCPPCCPTCAKASPGCTSSCHTAQPWSWLRLPWLCTSRGVICIPWWPGWVGGGGGGAMQPGCDIYPMVARVGGVVGGG